MWFLHRCNPPSRFPTILKLIPPNGPFHCSDGAVHFPKLSFSLFHAHFPLWFFSMLGRNLKGGKSTGGATQTYTDRRCCSPCCHMDDAKSAFSPLQSWLAGHCLQVLHIFQFTWHSVLRWTVVTLDGATIVFSPMYRILWFISGIALCCSSIKLAHAW